MVSGCYVLTSRGNPATSYTGQTSNMIRKRIQQHDQGCRTNAASRDHQRPWVLLATVEDTRALSDPNLRRINELCRMERCLLLANDGTRFLKEFVDLVTEQVNKFEAEGGIGNMLTLLGRDEHQNGEGSLLHFHFLKR